MKRKTISNAIRIHNVKDKNSHEWLYTQYLLYHPFQSELIDLKEARESKEECEKLFLHPTTLQDIMEDKDNIQMSDVIKVRQKVMPYIEDILEAREKIVVMNAEKIGDEIDATIAQENEECNQVRDELHPDFEVHHPDNFFEGNIPPRVRVTTYKRIDLWDKKKIRNEIRRLDPDQRYILDLFLKYARTLKLAKKAHCPFPDPPLLVIEGDAGSGKSELIRNLCQVMEIEFREAGDDPEQPYVLKGSFTGEAACNIEGQTLNSIFNIAWNKKFGEMTPALQAKKREDLKNLKLLIIDEYSMLKSDDFYRIHLRLQEIKINKLPFGGISVVLLGNILQLPPVLGNYIFEPPSSKLMKYGDLFHSLWDMFTPVILTYNHRQEGEAAYADMLKRLARGIVTAEDVALLRTRVYPENDPQIPFDTIYTFPTRVQVRQYNEKILSLLPGEYEVLSATNIMEEKRNFNPRPDEVDGKVPNTPFIQDLYLKIGAKVIMKYNIDVFDGLANGAKGVVVDFIRKDKEVTHVIIQFDHQKTGKAL